MRTIGKLICVAGAVFLVAQCVRPSLKNPPVAAEIIAPPEVKQILRKDCYSCHSNETRLSWYDEIVPAYWLARQDVKMARAHLNFSEIGTKPAAAQKGMLYEAVNQVQLGAMPLPRFLRLHPESRVTPEELAVLKAYLSPFGAAPKPDEKLTSARDAQYKAWAGGEGMTPVVQPELNGLHFYPDYKNWKVVSTTDRGDNHTMRVITGNDIAIHAIESGHPNPWPDGTVFAKITWAQTVDADGVVRPGEFKQVEFMVKGETQYASTAGWGFGRWLGMDLKPYGKGQAFANECVGCHNPVRDNDFVYTLPIQRKAR